MKCSFCGKEMGRGGRIIERPIEKNVPYSKYQGKKVYVCADCIIRALEKALSRTPHLYDIGED